MPRIARPGAQVGRRFLPWALLVVVAGILVTPASHAARRTYYFDAWSTVTTRTPSDNPVAVSASLEWDGGSCAGGPLYPLAIEVYGSDGFYDWEEAHWMQPFLYSTFYDSWVPTDPDDIVYEVWASYFDCGAFNWFDDDVGVFVPAEEPYPSHVVSISSSSPPDPCPGSCSGYQTDYTFRLMSQWPGVAVPGEHIDEDSNVTSNPCNDGFTEGDFDTNGAGEFVDYVWYCSPGSGSHPCCNSGSCQMAVDQVWSVGGTHTVAERTVYLDCTSHWIDWWW